MAAAMLPDSSIVRWSGYGKSWKLSRFIYDGENWVKESNQLTELINSIVYGDSHIHLRFSNDFTKLIVLFHAKKESKEKFISSSELFTRVRQTVMNNTMVVPQDGVIMGTGDEGGDFIFIRKDDCKQRSFNSFRLFNFGV